MKILKKNIEIIWRDDGKRLKFRRKKIENKFKIVKRKTWMDPLPLPVLAVFRSGT